MAPNDWFEDGADYFTVVEAEGWHEAGTAEVEEWALHAHAGVRAVLVRAPGRTYEGSVPGRDDDLHADARSLAAQHAYVESPRPEVPSLSGNIVSDVRAVAGLSTSDIASMFAVTEGDVARWRDDPQSIPLPTLRVLNGIQAIAATLVAGLGPRGVSRWLLQEPDAPARLLLEGRVDEAVGRAKAYEDSFAT